MNFSPGSLSVLPCLKSFLTSVESWDRKFNGYAVETVGLTGTVNRWIRNENGKAQ